MRFILYFQNTEFALYLQQQLLTTASHLEQEIECEFYSDPKILMNADFTSADAIFMPTVASGLNEIETALQIRRYASHIVIVFVTAYIKQSNKRFVVETFRYFMKGTQDMDLLTCLREIKEKIEYDKKSFLFQVEKESKQIPRKDILYIEGTRNRKIIVHTEKETFLCSGKLKDYESTLNDNGFLKIQRSFFVNMEYTLEFKNYSVTLTNGENLKTKRERYTKLIDFYTRWKKAHPI